MNSHLASVETEKQRNELFLLMSKHSINMVFSDIIIDVHTLEPIHYHNGASAVQGPFKKVVQHKYLERDEVKVWKEIDNNHSENYFEYRRGLPNLELHFVFEDTLVTGKVVKDKGLYYNEVGVTRNTE